MIVIKDSTISVFKQVLEWRRKRGCKVVVNFSGGKDSTFLLDLSLRFLGPKNIDAIIYVEVVGNTHPVSISLARKIIEYYSDVYGDVEDKFHIVKGYYKCVKHGAEDFFQYMIRHGGITFFKRWCMWKFKVYPMERYLHDVLHYETRLVIHLSGVKLSDSTFRSRYYADSVGKIVRSKPRDVNSMIAFPILEYTSSEVWSYLQQVAPDVYTELRRIYDRFGSTLNCVFCPFASKDAIAKIAASIEPEWRQKIIDALQRVETTDAKAEQVKRKWLRILQKPNESLTKYIDTG